MKKKSLNIKRGYIRGRKKLTVATFFMSLIIVSSCSTTSRLTEGETLYTGVKKFNVVPTDKEKLPGEMVSDLKNVINVAPNNPMPMLSPYVRSPFPVGLWVYNHMNDSAGGLKGWIYKKLVAQPILVADVKPKLRTLKMEEILDRNGYFGSTVNYDVVYDKRNPKKARLSYTLDVSSPYLIDSVIYLGEKTPLAIEIDSLARKSKYLSSNSRFCVDSLKDLRIDIANRLRNKGYYYFRPEYIEYLADSLITPHRIALKLTLAKGTPDIARRKFYTGRIVTTLMKRSNRNAGTPDTLLTDRGEVVVMRPQRLRESLIPSCIAFKEGKVFSVRDMDRTQNYLSRLGIFENIQIQPVPVDTSASHPVLDVYITAKYDRPMQVTLEVNATSKSNSYIGPGLTATLSHNNLFGGAERLSLQLTGSYEWQTGKNKGGVFNSYEFGFDASLAFPRLLAPKFIRRSRRELSWTTISLGADLLNRPHYFKLAEFSAGINYEWHYRRSVLNQFTPFKLTYTKQMRTTAAFDSVMQQNPAVALSFQSQFIPRMSYTYTLDKNLDRAGMNNINFTATAMEAGNIFSGIYSLCGVHGEKKLFGTPFSQFVKGQMQLVYDRRLFRGSDQHLVTRVLIGAEHAYGNSTEVPYSEQFYIGGANSIRAFTVRSLGPGSYRPPEALANGYFDQTGTFKLEMNCEYRFPIVGILHGAAFVDAGNIWLLKEDKQRPGGQLRGKTFFKDIALGTGVGLRVDISMLVVRGDLGYGLHAPYDTGINRYFNIAFKKAFAFHLAIGYPF